MPSTQTGRLDDASLLSMSFNVIMPRTRAVSHVSFALLLLARVRAKHLCCPSLTADNMILPAA
ncbi:uncharacterized protein C8R40DRAFT_1135911 [Lentinula edodes]|uniref:uncharacterized protein n=1 Tax=Lentinula edodes TaxID=5353 RepID=UPI001E8CC6E4|nr:uncharacterized protein C8R40DRAFT_1135911 [Lentinula edodes]KAH7868181.1 hypothetical protein C8R40DRAFT_1135911 [Lentinula edodes]